MLMRLLLCLLPVFAKENSPTAALAMTAALTFAITVAITVAVNVAVDTGVYFAPRAATNNLRNKSCC